jgi:hypothetical protein
MQGWIILYHIHAKIGNKYVGRVARLVNII